MKKILILLVLFPFYAHAQLWYSGSDLDSTTFKLTASDSLVHPLTWCCPFSTVSIDTSMAILWQIGRTLKPVFSNDTTASTGIMTDTTHPYPSNANDFFIVKLSRLVPNAIIDIWHRYETDSTHAGGIVEFSTDTGTTWTNVADCNALIKINSYLPSDTLSTGEPAFTGTSAGQIYSRYQYVNCFELKTTATSCMSLGTDGPYYIRFRFRSDSTIDSLSGWIIDSIKVENPGCVPGAVSQIGSHENISVYPNPADNKLTITSPTPITSITITNLLGQTLYTNKYNDNKIELDVSKFAAGVYFIKVNGLEVRKFMKE